MGRNIESFMAELRSDFPRLSAADRIDETSVRKDIITALKKFGNDICYMQEAVLKVDGGYAELPENFFKLDVAAICEPHGFKMHDIERHELQSSIFYKERFRYSSEWNECSSCCEDQSETIIKENLYVNMGRIEFFYKNPRLLTLGKSFDKKLLYSQCRNRLVRDCPDEINIIGRKLQTNFSSGYVYLVYNGFPLDDEGDIDIPETPNGNLEEFLEYRIKRKLAERLIGDGDNSLQSLYPTYIQFENLNLTKASNELKMNKLDPNSLIRRFKRLNKLESLQYENNIVWR